ncbi:MAG TPA: ankyrin repeat domain-containing protein [Candidatus Thermoplasmatota archaeon]|nr:ankyrin repeat domain-containing protein [Candidatus Thermoplasmatota archaeon]
MPTVEDMVAAIRAKDLSTAEKLLADDPSLSHARTPAGESMLLVAAYHHAKPLVELLLMRGARPNVWEAAAVGRLDRLRELLNANAAAIDAFSHDGWTPLHLAAHFGQKEICAYLLSRGAPVEARSRNALANTPLHAAAAGQQRTCVAILLQHGADPNATYLNGMTALHVTAVNGDDATARLLLAARARPDQRGPEGKTPLDLAREKGHAKVVRLLEQAGLKER